MKEIYFITATNTNIGKTKASEIFLKRFAKQGKKVGYMKPIETGVDTIPTDATAMFTLAKQLNHNFNVLLNDVVPYMFLLPASPFVAKDIDIDIEYIKSKANYLLKFCDVLIIEGAGGLMVPINDHYFMIDLIKEFDCHTILIVPSTLGSINDTLWSQMALNNKNIKYSWYINLYNNKYEFNKITLPFYEQYFTEIKYLE